MSRFWIRLRILLCTWLEHGDFLVYSGAGSFCPRCCRDLDRLDELKRLAGGA